MFHRSSRHNLSGVPSANERLPRQPVQSSSSASSPSKRYVDRDTANVDPRRIIVDHIIRDCYSKYETVNGAKVPEIKYNTHLNAREYSQYPQRPPPDDLSPAQIGSVKSRILVICTKPSGRVLLQKGKYNDEKRIYQIGRTWDLEELRCVNRIAADAIILLLNKDYYWQSGEGVERMQSFLYHLVHIYYKFTGRYPELRGITLAELGLDSKRSPTNKHAELRPAAPKDRAPPLKPQDQAALYRDMDFTANGKLPMKPMQVLDVDRPGRSGASAAGVGAASSANAAVAAGAAAIGAGAAAGAMAASAASLNPREITTISSPNRSKFLQDAFFNSPNTEVAASREQTPVSVKSAGLNENKPDLAATKSDIPTNKPDRFSNKSLDMPKQREARTAGPRLPLRKSIVADELNADDTVILADSYEEKPLANIKKSLSTAPSSRPTSVVDDSAINSSIREIEDFMDSQFGSHKRASGLGHRKNKLLQYRMEDFEDAASTFSNDTAASVADKAGTPLSDVGSVQMFNDKFEKDAEIDELLDEMGWNATDTTESFVRLLTKELATLKHNNVVELINLDFGKGKLVDEGKVSSNEITNLIYVFKKMEFEFQKIAPRISDLERNSKGLQVEAVNNKILLNDLSEILNKVKVSSLDLQLVSNYDDFEDLAQIPILEMKLLTIYDALTAIGSGEGLGQMKALQQYQALYENVALSFVARFNKFIHNKFVDCVAALSRDIDNLFPRNILASFTELTLYVGVGFFVRCISPEDFLTQNDNFNTILAEFLSKYFDSRLKLAKEGQQSKSNRLSQGYESLDGLGKRRSGRFGSTRLISKFSHVEEPLRPKLAEATPAPKDNTFDPRTILRMVQENKELILVVQFFCCNFFHSVGTSDFSAFISSTPFDERMKEYKTPDVYLTDYKANSNELVLNMNAIFGNYINNIVKTFTPADLQVPQLLLDLHKLLSEAKAQYQNFVAYSFIRKLIDRYKSIWVKFVAHNVSILQKSDIRAKMPLLAGVKNLNVIVLTTETTLQDSQVHLDDESAAEVLAMVQESYEQLTEAMVDLFGREDPLLKYNAHDEKERAHRNVAILQNLFSALQQLTEFSNTSTTASMKQKLEGVFQRVQNEYTTYLLRRFFNKMLDFVALNSEADSALKKKDNKILIKALVSSHAPKEMSAKVSELHHKMERHYLTTNTVFEQDLLATMWKYTEDRVVDLFLKFFAYAKAMDRDVDECITIPALRNLFKHPR